MEMHICTTGQQFSFRESDTALEDRTAIFSGFRYGDAPDAVLVVYGIQGSNYFKGIREHWDDIKRGCKCIMGYVWKRHAPIYKRVFRGVATVEVLFTGYPYGEEGPEMSWIVVTPIGDIPCE